MKKKITLLILVCLVALLACTLIACNKNGAELVSSAPEEIGPGIYSDDDNDPQEIDGGYALLSFQFVDEMSSLFHSITIDETNGFDITSVNYIVSFTKGGTTTVSSPKPLSKDYLDSNSQDLLYKKGHHTIHVSIPYGTSVLKGSFSLHLRYAYEEVEPKTLKFNLNGGIARFTSYSEDVATIKIEEGLTFTYDEFFRNFTITKKDSAIDYFEVDGNTVKKLQRVPTQGASNTITITKDTTFTCVWTTNTIKVTFSVSKPATDATVVPGMEEPRIAEQYVTQSVGVIQRPLDDMNAYNGYYFAGWYTAPDGNNSARVWNFTTPVGQDNITLYAHWSIKYYSATIYPMGGDFKSTLESIQPTSKMMEATCTVVNNAASGLPTTVEISGLTYGKKYSDYYVNVQIGNETKTISLATLFSAFDKPVTEKVLVGKISSDENLYSSQTCASDTAISASTTITTSPALYVKWNFDIDKEDEDYVDTISAFYTDVLFKNSYYIKADGSIMIYDIQDETFNEIIVPDYIVIDGVKRYISEIGNKGVMNVRSLGKIDMSDATHLTTIGREAFINCKNLLEIVWPTQNNISTIGYSAFENTAWEDVKIAAAKDEDNPGSKYIVVNDILYKYIDLSTVDSKITTINMNDDAADLQGVTVIGERAFKDSIYLKEVTILNSIVEIKNYAFMNSDELDKVNAGTALNIVRAAAFEGTLLYEDTSKNIKLMKDAYGADVRVIVVGNVLDDVLDKYIETFKISDADGITAIAEEAFETCNSLEEIIIDTAAEAKITYIGANAFTTPVEFLRTVEKNNEGYFIINGKLTEYYNSDYYFYDAVIPNTVATIGPQAFGGYSRYLKTIQIGSKVTYIDEYAFLGATQLRSLLFSSVQYNGLEKKMYNLPNINPLAFSNEDDGLINNIDFYFYGSILSYFENLATGKEKTTDAKELAWLELYVKNKDHFKEEKIEKIYVNTNVVPTLYVVSANDGWGTYAKGLILESSAGVIKYEQFNSSTMVGSFNSSQEGTWTANIQQNSQYTGATYVQFTYTIVHNVTPSVKFDKDGVTPKAPPFYSSKDNTTIINGDSLKYATDSFEVVGFDGIDTTSEGYPVFYTSQSSINLEDIKLKYKTWQLKEKELVAVDYSDFIPNSNRVKTITFTFELCTGYKYKVQLSYKGVEAKLESIQQTDPISIPLNANVSAALGQSLISYYCEDGIVTNEYLNMSDYDIVSVNGQTSDLTLYSNTLGLNTIVLKYKGTKKVISSLQDLTIVYAVVLEGDASQFAFDRKGNGWVITAHNNKNVETLVIPSSYTSADGLQLDVIEISDNVFNGYTNMTTLYLPSTIKKIGSGAFKNCTVLRNIYSSESTENIKTAFVDDTKDFTVLTKDVFETGYVNISLLDLSSGAIVIPNSVIYSKAPYIEGGITVNTQVEATPVLTEKMFDSFAGTVYLDYTEENLDYVKSNLINSKTNTANGIEIVFMFKDSRDVDALNKNSKLQFLQYTETNIAFVNKQINPKDKDGKAVDMDVNYLFYYVISDAQPRKASTQQRHFTIDASSLVVESRVIEQTRELTSLTQVASGLDTIIIGDVYETFAYVGGTFTSQRYSYDIEEEKYVGDKNGLFKKVVKDVYVLIPEEDIEGFVGTKYSYDEELKAYKEDEAGTYKKEQQDTYELLSLEEMGVAQNIISKTTAIKDQITYVGALEFIVYLPDTIYNTCVIKNSSGTAQTIIIYKHGEELLYSTKNAIPEAIEYIGNDAFENCIALKAINLSGATKLEYIGTNAFAKSGLTSIDLSNTIIKEINNQTFADCTDLVTVKLSNKTYFIGTYAFDGCTKLVLADDFFVNVQTISAYAFNKCTGLVTVDMTKATNLTKIGTQAFSHAGTKVIVAKAADKTKWASDWYGFCTYEEV